jgi:hypothetical protein
MNCDVLGGEEKCIQIFGGEIINKICKLESLGVDGDLKIIGRHCEDYDDLCRGMDQWLPPFQEIRGII